MVPLLEVEEVESVEEMEEVELVEVYLVVDLVAVEDSEEVDPLVEEMHSMNTEPLVEGHMVDILVETEAMEATTTDMVEMVDITTETVDTVTEVVAIMVEDKVEVEALIWVEE